MALTRKLLKSLGLSDEQIEPVVDAHDETVSGLKQKIADAEKRADEAENKVADYDKIVKENNDLKKGDWKAKYEKEHGDFESFKKDAEEKATRTAKEAAARAYFEGKKITGANLEIAMRGSRDEIKGLELDGGTIKDTASLDALIDGTFAGLVGKISTKGASTATPPASGKTRPTKEDILKIENDDERQAAIAKNLDLFD